MSADLEILVSFQLHLHSKQRPKRQIGRNDCSLCGSVTSGREWTRLILSEMLASIASGSILRP